MAKQNWLDRAIGYISPKTAYVRQAWRSARSIYDAGGIERPNGSWRPHRGPAELGASIERGRIRDRARDLEANSDFVGALLSALERNVIGNGMSPQPKLRDAKGKDLDVLNKKIEAKWREWSRAKNCDTTQQQSFDDMQRMVLRRVIVDGAVMMSYVDDAKSRFRLRLQFREIDELDESKNSTKDDDGHFFYGGIEFDQNKTPVAFHLKDYEPNGTWLGKTSRITNKQMLYLWEKNRPTQVREMSHLACTLGRIRDLNEYMVAVAMKERVAACFSAAITQQTPANTIGRLGAKAGAPETREESLAPGTILYLQPGETVSSIAPAAQASDSAAYIAVQQRIIGASLGLSYEGTSRDMERINYSSARQGLLEDQRTYAKWQRFLIDRFCRPVYCEFIRYLFLTGELTGLGETPEAYMAHDWAVPGWSWIDPVKEVNANKTALDSHQDTLQKIYADQGRDWQEALRQRAKEVALMKELGLSGGDAFAQTPK